MTVSEKALKAPAYPQSADDPVIQDVVGPLRARLNSRAAIHWGFALRFDETLGRMMTDH
jgi:hypothetical protein